MKKNLQIILLLLLFQTLNAQSWAPVGAKWYYSELDQAWIYVNLSEFSSGLYIFEIIMKNITTRGKIIKI
ncbi:MAG: hypothetical protein HY738_10185 [Bacteroidia bacterium]|nr:hypothetical protein [Bacteroidia bacterium]